MILVAGGGLAGSAGAILLAQAGRDVTLIEREAGPSHKVCGEFLSGEALGYLERLGLNLAALGGEPITHVRLARGQHVITAPLPFKGVSLTRKSLDEALLGHAAQAGVTVRRGHAIRKISFELGISVTIDQCETMRPQTLLLATGKHETRGAPRDAQPSRFVGFKTYFNLAAAQRAELSAHVELIMFRGGYAGLQCVESGAANLSLLIDAAMLKQLGGKWANVLEYMQAASPHLAARLAGAAECLPTPLTIARVPYGFTYRPAPSDPPGLFRLGDQAAVIQSFTGDGMAIALHSAALAARHVIAGQPGAHYHGTLRAGISGQIRRASTLHALMASPFLGPALFAGARLWPPALRTAAAWTRVAGVPGGGISRG